MHDRSPPTKTRAVPKVSDSSNAMKELAAGEFEALRRLPAQISGAVPQRGPRTALQELNLGGLSASDRLAWAEMVRVQALVGDRQASKDSLLSGIRCYCAFMSKWIISFLDLYMRDLCYLCCRASFPGSNTLFPSQC